MTLADAHRIVAENPSHKEWQSQVCGLLDTLGFRYLHVRTTTGKVHGRMKKLTGTNITGWPDLAPVWRPGRPEVFAIELKVGADRLKVEQAGVMRMLAGTMVGLVVEPGDLQALALVLTGRRAPGHLAWDGRLHRQPRLR